MNSFDAGVIHWMNGFAHRSEFFDRALGSLANSDLLKGYLFMLGFWWLWFAAGPQREKNREIVTATLLAACAAILGGRLLALLLPFRVRPIFNEALAFVAPFGSDRQAMLRTWSAFPSDHAMMFSAFATGLWSRSRKLGLAAHAYWFLVIGLPRVYLGLHHPTDILGGAVIGAAMGWAANAPAWRPALVRQPLEWSRRHESSFYTAFFVFSVQIVTMFEGPKDFLHLLSRLHKGQ